MNQINLVCIPFAGGSKFSYRHYVETAPDRINVMPVELPGRGKRYKEKLLTDLDLLTEDIYNQVRGRLNRPYAIYGHSMGTLLGYLLVKKMVACDQPLPVHLFLSGREGPSVPRDQTPDHLLDSGAFWQRLREFGGSPDEVLADPKLMGFYEPIFRADFKAVETYAYTETRPFNVPVTVLIGQDENITREEAMAWQKETRKDIDVKTFPGGHFFIFDHAKEIMALIDEKLHF